MSKSVPKVHSPKMSALFMVARLKRRVPAGPVRLVAKLRWLGWTTVCATPTPCSVDRLSHELLHGARQRDLPDALSRLEGSSVGPRGGQADEGKSGRRGADGRSKSFRLYGTRPARWTSRATTCIADETVAGPWDSENYGRDKTESSSACKPGTERPMPQWPCASRPVA